MREKTPFGGKGFTLIELLLVIGILAVLSMIAMVVLDPFEQYARSRDASRTADLRTAASAIEIAIFEDPSIDSTEADRVYLSLPDTNGNVNDDCKASGEYPSLPDLPSGWEYRCRANTTNLRNTDGTGWMPISFATLSDAPIKVLPVDPVNNEAQYYGLMQGDVEGAYSLFTPMESVKFAGVETLDGGTSNEYYETAPMTFSMGGGGGSGTPPTVAGLAFNGQDDYVRIASSASLNITNNLTVEAWIYPRTVAADNDWRTVVGKLEAGTGGYELGLETNQSGLYFDVQLPGGIVATSYTFPTLDTWYHVVGTFSSGPDMKLYVNGALVDDTEQTFGGGPFTGTISTSSKPLYIGADPQDSSYCPREFFGEVDEVRIYSRKLSDTEVAEHYNGTFTNEANLAGLWHFDEGAGMAIIDSSGNGNNGAIVAPLTGGAMSFDGSGDYITVPDSASIDLTGEFTIEGWIRRDSVPQLSNWRLILGKKGSGGFPEDVYGWMTDMNFGFMPCSNGEGECSLGFFQTNSGGFMAALPDSLNEWHHFVTTYNRTADRATIYWDYDLNGSDTTLNVPTSTGVLYIGGNGSGSGIAPYDFAGDLDDVRFYGKELPSSVVRSHFLGDYSVDATGCGGASCNLRAYWAFNEGGGPTVSDLSGNGNHGTISGNPGWIPALDGADRVTH